MQYNSSRKTPLTPSNAYAAFFSCHSHKTEQLVTVIKEIQWCKKVTICIFNVVKYYTIIICVFLFALMVTPK